MGDTDGSKWQTVAKCPMRSLGATLIASSRAAIAVRETRAYRGGLLLHRSWLICVLAVALCVASCSTPVSTATGASNTPATQTYSQIAAELIAATRTQDSYQSTAMSELGSCRFAYEIAPGRQSVLQFSFDVRQLNLNAISTAEGQAAQSEFFARRIACASNQGFCASYNGRPIDYVEIVSPTPEDLDRALGALRHAQSACSQSPPPAD